MELKNLNNTTVATIADGATNQSTDLTFFGYKFKGYGSSLNTNMLHLLEHFRNQNSVNMKPVKGQLWYDSSSEMLKLCTDASSKNWVNISFAAAVTASSTNSSPTGFVTITGDSKAGSVLTASNTIVDNDNKGPITYQWKVDGADISTGITYTAARLDAGKRITVVAKYTDGLGRDESVISSPFLIDSPLYGDVFRAGPIGNGEFATATSSFVIDPETTPYDVSKSTSHQITQVAVGLTHIIALRNDGLLLSMGNDFNGQIATNTQTGLKYPKFQPENSMSTNWKFIAAGDEHNAAIQKDGTLWVNGDGMDGQLGLGQSINGANMYRKVGSDANWAFVACGDANTVAIKSNGSLWGTGKNSNSALGIAGVANIYTFTQIGSDTNWRSVACGSNFTLAIKTDGSLWGTGAAGGNGKSNFGNGSTTDLTTFTRIGSDNDWKSVSCGESHTLAIKTNGTLWATGDNTNGQLGLGNNTNAVTFVKVGSDTNWESVDVGNNRSVAIKTDGSLWATGNNGDGQLGLGDKINRNEFTRVGNENTWVQASCKLTTAAIKY